MPEIDIASIRKDPDFVKASPEEKLAGLKKVFTAKDPDFAKSTPEQQQAGLQKLFPELAGTGSVFEPPPTTGQRLKTIGQNMAVQAAGTAPAIAGAEMGAGVGGAVGGPPGAIVGGLGGAAIGGLAIPAFEYAASRLVGLDKPVPTYAEAGHAALNNAVGQMAGPVLERTYVRPVAEALLGTGKAALEAVFGIRPGLVAARAAGQAAEAQGAELTAKQAQATAEIQASRAQTGTAARAEYSDAVKDAESQVTKAKAKIANNIQRDVESARPEAAAQVAQSQAQGMVGKTSAQFAQEAAQPYEQRASALSRASNPAFDASAKFHGEVGAKFDPYIGKIKDNAVAPASLDGLGGMVSKVESTLEQRGQRIESPELRQIIDSLRGRSPEDLEPGTDIGPAGLSIRSAGRAPKGVGGPGAVQITEAQLRKLQESGIAPETPPKTYGQLWGARGRANKVLATAKNPADRWAANEVVSEIDHAIPGIPPEIRSQYAFERKISRPLLSKISSARTPQEVGEAIFGSKSNPEPAEVPLSIIRFTKQHAPEQMDGVRQAFADRYLGNRMDANDLGKMNPNVLKELYGNNADSVIRLLGPEGNVKQAAWGELIKTDPQAKALYQKAVQDSLQKQQNVTLQETVDAGEKALKELGTEGDALRRAVAKEKIPEAKIKLLAQGLPDVEAAKMKGFKSGVRKGAFQFERYMQRRLGFMGMFALMGGGGSLMSHPIIGVTMGLALGGRAGMRQWLSTDSGARTAMRLLDMTPNLANVPAFGRGTAALLSATLANHIAENPISAGPAAPPAPTAP